VLIDKVFVILLFPALRSFLVLHSFSDEESEGRVLILLLSLHISITKNGKKINGPAINRRAVKKIS